MQHACSHTITPCCVKAGREQLGACVRTPVCVHASGTAGAPVESAICPAGWLPPWLTPLPWLQPCAWNWKALCVRLCVCVLLRLRNSMELKGCVPYAHKRI